MTTTTGTRNTGTRNAVLLALAIALAAVPMMADARGDKGPRINFEEIDANSDGELTQAEFDAHRTARFTSADANGDGLLNKEEMLARARDGANERMTHRVERMIERLDSNDDGQLSEEELQARAKGRRGDIFERLDADKSGSISKAEFEQAKANRKGKRGQSQSQDN